MESDEVYSLWALRTNNNYEAHMNFANNTNEMHQHHFLWINRLSNPVFILSEQGDYSPLAVLGEEVFGTSEEEFHWYGSFTFQVVE